LVGTHPQAYEELKKRLLNEYNKLVSTKKGFKEKKKVIDESSNPSPHLNVYKPTFIINNSFGE
jgi:hypothetical protein